MTFRRFFGLALVLWLLLAILKAVFLNVLNLDSFAWSVVYGFLVFIISMACARRLGVINYLEAMMVCVVWLIMLFLLDYFVLRLIVGLQVFARGMFWISYLVMLFAVFFFHKKRHVEIRRELAAHHHAHEHRGPKEHGDHHQQPHGQHGPGKH